VSFGFVSLSWCCISSFNLVMAIFSTCLSNMFVTRVVNTFSSLKYSSIMPFCCNRVSLTNISSSISWKRIIFFIFEHVQILG
jgi:hypothetical protein